MTSLSSTNCIDVMPIGPMIIAFANVSYFALPYTFISEPILNLNLNKFSSSTFPKNFTSIHPSPS